MSRPTILVSEVTWEEAQARFATAMKKLYDADALAADLSKKWPGAQPENIFDLPDGMRMIVSREDIPLVPGKRLIHVSSSCWGPDRKPKHIRTLSEIEVWTLENLNRVGRFDPPITFDSGRMRNRMISPMGVVHFWFTEEP